MQTILSNEEDEMVSLEFICEEIKEQLKLILALIERYKIENPHLKQQQFKAKKQLLFQILHESSSNLVEVTLYILVFFLSPELFYSNLNL